MSDRQIHINREGQQFGPYPEAHAHQLLTEDQLLVTDLAWHEGAEDWKPLNEVLGLSTAEFEKDSIATGSGNSKKVALIAGIVVLMAGLTAAGYFFLYSMLAGGGKIETSEELAKQAVQAFSKKDYEAFEKLTPLSWTKSDWEKTFEELFSDEMVGEMSKTTKKPLAEIKEEMNKEAAKAI